MRWCEGRDGIEGNRQIVSGRMLDQTFQKILDETPWEFEYIAPTKR